MPHVDKRPLANGNLAKTKKLGLEWNMNGMRKPFRKKSDSKNRKNSKNQSEISPFSHSTLKLEQKISSRKTTRFFAPRPDSA